MHVDHLLEDESLGLRLLWAEEPQLRREISGVTATDLEDPARFVRSGEVVLSGLVWWSPEGGRDKAERFVSALRTAGAAVLLAGEETHGSVPDDLIEACARHGVPVAAVPAHIMFRAITDTVYFQQWGELNRLHALPQNVRGRLSRLVAQDAGPDVIVATAFAHVERAVAYVFTPAGRTVAATEGADAVPVREAVASLENGMGITVPVEADAVSPYERWHLYLPEPGSTPPRMLHEIAAILARCQESRARRRAAEHRTADELGTLLASSAPEAAAVEGALRACGLPAEGPYRVIVAETGPRRTGLAEGALTEGALTEVVAHARPRGSSVGCLPGGGVAVAHGGLGGSSVGRLPGDATAVARAGLGGSSVGCLPGGGVAVARAGSGGASVGCLPDGTAFAVVRETDFAAVRETDFAADMLAEVWPLVAACEPSVPLYGGVGAPAAGPQDLNGALAEARYALASARTTAPESSSLIDSSSLTGLDTLLTGIPAEVRTAYSRTVLGPLLDTGNASAAALLQTLETFLAHDGSWARTAEALHLHVNTVHYRVQRIEHFTGRDLSRLYDRLDLWAALLCRTRPATTDRRARSSTSPAR